VTRREALGSEMLVHFSVAARQGGHRGCPRAGRGRRRRPRRRAAEREAAAQASLVGRFSPHTRIREGDAIEVAVDPRALYFFDPETGLAIYG
jgi:multiple sugar transport system ATP-binding protein